MISLKPLHLAVSICALGQSFLTFGSSSTYGKFYQKEMWHTTYVLMKEEAKKEIKNKNQFSKILNKVLEKINPEVIFIEGNVEFEQIQNESLDYIIGKKNYTQNENKKALQHLLKVGKNSSYYPESRLIMAQIYNKEKDEEKIKGSTKECIQSSMTLKKKYRNDRDSLKYYDNILNNCIMLIGRKAFNEDELNKSLKIFSVIDKRSVTFTSSLVEKSWIYYFQKNYNRALGLLATFKSPLLKDRFYPEVEYLSILANYRLCLWDEVSELSEKSINTFSKNLQQLDVLEKLDREKMLGLIFEKESKDKILKDHFTQSFFKRINENPKFQFTLNQLRMINNEYNMLKKLKKRNKKNKILKHLKNHKEDNLNLLFQMSKKQISIYKEQIKKFENNIIELKIRTLERKKEYITNKKKPVNLKLQQENFNIERKENEHFWKFDGEFWADEIGDYSFSIKSNCVAEKKNDT